MEAVDWATLAAVTAETRELCRRAEMAAARSLALRDETDEAVLTALRARLDSRPWHQYARLDGLVGQRRQPVVVRRDGSVHAAAEMRRRIDLVRTLADVLDGHPVDPEDPLLVTMQVAQAYDDLWLLDLRDARIGPAARLDAAWVRPAQPGWRDGTGCPPSDCSDGSDGSASDGSDGSAIAAARGGPADPLSVLVEDVGEAQVVHVAGEVDISVTERLRRAIVETGGPAVHVDLSGVTFIDAAGAGALVAARNEIERRGHRLSVLGARGIVRRVFDLCGLSDLVRE